MADDRAARLLTRQDRLRTEQMAQANQDILGALTQLVRVIGDQNNAQTALNQLTRDAIDAMRDNTAAAGGAGGAAATFAISPGTVAPDALTLR